jgi:hypothetical protein
MAQLELQTPAVAAVVAVKLVFRLTANGQVAQVL